MTKFLRTEDGAYLRLDAIDVIEPNIYEGVRLDGYLARMPREGLGASGKIYRLPPDFDPAGCLDILNPQPARAKK